MNTPAPFKREHRYIVVKLKDAEAYLSKEELQRLVGLESEVAAARSLDNRPRLNCLVVESDWPEYEPTWKAIEARMTAPTAPTETPEEGRFAIQPGYPTMEEDPLHFELRFGAGFQEYPEHVRAHFKRAFDLYTAAPQSGGGEPFVEGPRGPVAGEKNEDRLKLFHKIKAVIDDHSKGSKDPIGNPIVLTFAIMDSLTHLRAVALAADRMEAEIDRATRFNTDIMNGEIVHFPEVEGPWLDRREVMKALKSYRAAKEKQTS